MLGMEMPGMDGMKMDGMKMDEMKMPADQQAESKKGTVNYGMEGMDRVEGRREAIGMRPGWSMGVEGLSTVVRILPPELYEQITGDKGHEGHKIKEKKK